MINIVLVVAAVIHIVMFVCLFSVSLSYISDDYTTEEDMQKFHKYLALSILGVFSLVFYILIFSIKGVKIIWNDLKKC